MPPAANLLDDGEFSTLTILPWLLSRGSEYVIISPYNHECEPWVPLINKGLVCYTEKPPNPNYTAHYGLVMTPEGNNYWRSLQQMPVEQLPKPANVLDCKSTLLLLGLTLGVIKLGWRAWQTLHNLMRNYYGSVERLKIFWIQANLLTSGTFSYKITDRGMQYLSAHAHHWMINVDRDTKETFLSFVGPVLQIIPEKERAGLLSSLSAETAAWVAEYWRKYDSRKYDGIASYWRKCNESQ